VTLRCGFRSDAVGGRRLSVVAERVRVREIDDDEGQRLLRIVRRGTGSVVTWRRAQMVLLSAQGMDPVKMSLSDWLCNRPMWTN
jgi:hypothetical protein